VSEQEKRAPSAAGIVVALLVGAAVGGGVVEYLLTRSAAPVGAQAGAGTPGAAPASDVAADIARLKDLVPSQSHTMSDVGYHWAGLWFAAKAKNWPLAEFFYGEARQHIRWTVAIRPVRKGPDKADVNLKGIVDALEPTVFATVQLAIQDKNTAEFETAYKDALTGCYSCHKASGKPYLRPQVPTTPPLSIINFDPAATWPE
jgi:cytochrome c553